MSKKQRAIRISIRCIRFVALAAALAVIAAPVFAQGTSSGILVTKTCPDPLFPIPQGSAYQCTFSVQNLSDVAIDNLVVTNEFPFPAGTPVAVACTGGLSATSLSATGTAGDTCGGTLNEVAPVSCNPEDEQVIDEVVANAQRTDNDGPVSGSATNGPTVAGQNCEVDEVCRTPGFWGSHADADPEKACSQDITLATLCWVDGVAGCQGGEAIEICGECISNTIVPTNLAQGDASSAIEALCVRVRGDEFLQLARQLTAARLNCIVSGETGGACDGVSINAVFDACNTACAAEDETITVGPDEISCIDAIDCFNNGGVFSNATGICSFPFACSDDMAPCTPGVTDCGKGAECLPVPSCHSAEFPDDFLPNDFLADTHECFEKQGPAGSSDECKRATKNDCTVIGPGEDECTADSDACLD